MRKRLGSLFSTYTKLERNNGQLFHNDVIGFWLLFWHYSRTKCLSVNHWYSSSRFSFTGSMHWQSLFWFLRFINSVIWLELVPRTYYGTEIRDFSTMVIWDGWQFFYFCKLFLGSFIELSWKRSSIARISLERSLCTASLGPDIHARYRLFSIEAWFTIGAERFRWTLQTHQWNDLWLCIFCSFAFQLPGPPWLTFPTTRWFAFVNCRKQSTLRFMSGTKKWKFQVTHPRITWCFPMVRTQTVFQWVIRWC